MGNQKLLGKTIRGVLLASAGFMAGPALAGYDLYKSDDAKITFNFDAVAATFMNQDSWFGESKSFLGKDTDDWSEYGFEPKISFEAKLGGGTVFGEFSGVYTNTAGDDASGLTIGNGNNSSTDTEQAHVGWKIADLFSGLEDDEFSISGGRQDYKIGSGMLIADGGSDGGEHGGWYLGMRKAFMESAIARIEGNGLLAEAFRIENRPRRGGTRGNAVGGNLEYTFFETMKLGGTWMVVDAELPGYDELDVYDARLDWTGKDALEGFALSGEFAHEESDQIEADGWFAEASWGTKEICWSPTFSYRYAHFDGDDPNTPEDEQFREIAYGFSDYGSWFQGEITGNYPLANGNTNTHRLRVKMQPNESVTLNVMYYDYTLDQEQIWGDPVTSDDWGQELNFTVDWAATEQIYVIGVLGNLSPGDAAKQWTGGDEDWLYSMVYVSYAY